MGDEDKMPLHLLQTRLSLRDPTNPGMGPTRYISKDPPKRLDPEETKLRIKVKTERLAAELLKTSIETKKKLNDAYWLHQRELHDYNEKVKEKGRLRQSGQLKLGCDLVKTSEESRLNRERREKRRAKIKQDFSVIREMRGTLEFNLATPELSEVIEKHIVPYKMEVGDSGKFKLPTPLQRLSVGRYRTMQDLGVVLREGRSISDIQDIELERTEKKFPIIAMEMEHSKSNGVSFERSKSLSFDQLRASSRGNSAGLSSASWRSRPGTVGSNDGEYAFPSSSFSPGPGNFDHFPVPTGSIISLDGSQETVYKTGGQLDIDSVDFSNIINNDGILKTSGVIDEEVFPSKAKGGSMTTSVRPKSREDLIYDVILTQNGSFTSTTS